MEINKSWAENAFVTKAELIHSRVHDPEKSYALRGKRVFTAVWVYNDRPEYDLYGVTDCIEATPDKNGVTLPGHEGKYRLCVVEYKPTMPRGRAYNPEDLMQVFAQKLCVDYVFGGDCDGVLYYADGKKRVLLPLREDFAGYDALLRKTLGEMRTYMEQGKIPPIPKGQRCSGCSMKDICMPAVKKGASFRERLRQLGEEEL